MDTPFGRVKSIINRLIDVLKCQKCLQLKKEDIMLFYRSCDHFFCSDCVKKKERCPICENILCRPINVLSDKNMLSLYQSLSKFELPSKNDIQFIYDSLKESKEKSLEIQQEVSLEKEKEESIKNEFKKFEKLETVKNNDSSGKESEENTKVCRKKNKSFSNKISHQTVADELKSNSKISSKNIKESKENIFINQLKISSDNQNSELTENNLVIVEKYNNDNADKMMQNESEKKLTGKKRGKQKKQNIATDINSSGETSTKYRKNNEGKKTLIKTPLTEEKSLKTNLSVTPSENRVLKTNNGNEPGNFNSNKLVSKLNINKRNPKGETLLHLACKKSDFKRMRELINAGADANAKDNAGWTPLHDSVFSDNLKVIKFLLKNGAKVNMPGLENSTALHEAVARGNTAIVLTLIEHGADINAQNICRESPLDLATKFNLTELKEILLTNQPAAEFSDCKMEVDDPVESIIVYMHGVSMEDEKLVNKFSEKFGLVIVSSVTEKQQPTHVMVSNDQFDVTWAVISSVFARCWLITVDWAKDSIKEGQLKSAASYQLSDKRFEGFARSRANHKNFLPELFCGCHFFFGGLFESYNVKNVTVGKEELKRLVEKNGGKILKRCPDPESLALEKTIPFHANPSGSLKETSYFIIYQTEKWNPVPKYAMSHLKTLPVDWLLSCIYRFELIDPKEYSGSVL